MTAALTVFTKGDGLLQKDFERWPAKLPVNAVILHSVRNLTPSTSFSSTMEIRMK